MYCVWKTCEGSNPFPPINRRSFQVSRPRTLHIRSEPGGTKSLESGAQAIHRVAAIAPSLLDFAYSRSRRPAGECRSGQGLIVRPAASSSPRSGAAREDAAGDDRAGPLGHRTGIPRATATDAARATF
jgi:hypothetical protein